MNGSKPVLWHIPVSHYSEKARWACPQGGRARAPRPDSGRPHGDRAVAHPRSAKTFPVLRLDGRNIGDSTAIIEALEHRWPERPLYPEDPAERRRALELEDHFDDELGPQVRLLGWHELRKDPELMGEVTRTMVPEPMKKLPGWGGRRAALRDHVHPAPLPGRGRRGRRRGPGAMCSPGFDRLEAELDAGGGEYLVGERFSVADLTAAALFYPVVTPPEGPQILPADPPAGFVAFQESVSDRPGFKWVETMYARHREPAATAAAAASAA